MLENVNCRSPSKRKCDRTHVRRRYSGQHSCVLRFEVPAGKCPAPARFASASPTSAIPSYMNETEDSGDFGTYHDHGHTAASVLKTFTYISKR